MRNEFSAFERHAALWNYAMFFHGEDAVTDALSPYIDAAPQEERKYFLATQRRRGGPAAAPASPQSAPGASGACKHPPLSGPALGAACRSAVSASSNANSVGFRSRPSAARVGPEADECFARPAVAELTMPMARGCRNSRRLYPRFVP
jgi:hypothetical protein